MAKVNSLVDTTHLKLENLELDKFQYFKYLSNPPPKPFYFKRHGELYSIVRKPDPPPSTAQDTFNRVKAVFNYFKHLFFGNPKHQENMRIEFPPERAEILGKDFQMKYGKFGELLVNSLGSK